MLLEAFSADRTPRQGQRHILEQMESLLKSGHTRIIVSAPTGIGKSYVAKAVADAIGDSFVVTSTKQLQDQYLHDFPHMRSIKGMSNFACRQLMETGKIDSTTMAMAKGMTCDKGRCTGKSAGRVTYVCPYKDPLDEQQCIYYKQRDDGLRFAQTILNYAMYFQLKRYQPDKQGVDRTAVVFDEAHTIEDEVVRFIGYDIRGSYLTETGLDQRRYDMESVDGIVELLDALRVGYASQLDRDREPRTSSDIMRVQRMSRRLDGVVAIRREINQNRSNFVVQEPQFDGEGDFGQVSVIPLDVSKYAAKMFDSSIQVFMSATIDKNNFSRILGIGECGFVDIKESPFPARNRRIKFLDVARLSMRSPESDEIRVASMIESLLATHPNSRGLILTSSKARCYRLMQRINNKQSRRIQVAHSKNKDESTMGEILEEHSRSHNGVLLSSSLWQGIDLKGDLSRFQIIEKCPYPNLGDPRVAAMNRSDRRWYIYKTIVRILQGFGRSIRDADDHAVTYVLDAAVHDILSRNRDMVPAAYHDTIYATN